MEKKLIKAIEAMSADERRTVKEKLTSIVDEIDKYRHSYFWNPSSIAVLRRKNEFEREEIINIGEYKITFQSRYRESCQHCYYTTDLLFNGNKTNTTRLNNIIAKIKELEKVEV